MRCLLGGRFSMDAEILHWEGLDAGTPEDVTSGHWDTYQDPLTGELRNIWIPAPDTDPDPNVITPQWDTIPCIARGIVDGGIRVAGTTERFGDTYENIDYVKLWTPSYITVTKRDRVTNIREKKGGTIVWKNEEGNDNPTIFNVNGVTPLFDAFNRHVENFVLLERTNG